MSKYELQQFEKHCVFRCGSHWFAAPAVGVREVVPRPTIVGVPDSPSMLVGLGHLRNEFVPVLSLQSLLEGHETSDLAAEQMLIMASPANASWAILVDAVSALAALDVSINTDGRSQDAWSAAVMGSATCRGEIVRVLDINAVYRLASQRLAPNEPLESQLVGSSQLACLESNQ